MQSDPGPELLELLGGNQSARQTDEKKTHHRMPRAIQDHLQHLDLCRACIPHTPFCCSLTAVRAKVNQDKGQPTWVAWVSMPQRLFLYSKYTRLDVSLAGVLS